MKITNVISSFAPNLSYQITEVKGDGKYKKDNTIERHNEDTSCILQSRQRWLSHQIEYLNTQKESSVTF